VFIVDFVTNFFFVDY